MGFSDPTTMRTGLAAVRDAEVCSAGTITLDSFTRVGDHSSARRALLAGKTLNGFPIVVHGARVTNDVVSGLLAPDFPIQVRHGTALPDNITAILMETDLDATEGGPISYALPYGRTPLKQTIASWGRCCEVMASRSAGRTPWHIETFGGCMMGQLCPPELLIALSVLEVLFFAQHGIRSVSLSYAQQTNPIQDVEALRALQILAERYLGGLDWHLVLYSWMGLFPSTRAGARRLLNESVTVACSADVGRLVVKTSVEARRIPTIAENVSALETAHALVDGFEGAAIGGGDTGILDGASSLLDNVLNEAEDLSRAIPLAFERGHLDVPYCLHPDNPNRARSYVDRRGWLQWSHPGTMSLVAPRMRRKLADPTAHELLAMLSYNRRRFDNPHGDGNI